MASAFAVLPGEFLRVQEFCDVKINYVGRISVQRLFASSFMCPLWAIREARHRFLIRLAHLDDLLRSLDHLRAIDASFARVLWCRSPTSDVPDAPDVWTGDLR